MLDQCSFWGPGPQKVHHLYHTWTCFFGPFAKDFHEDVLFEYLGFQGTAQCPACFNSMYGKGRKIWNMCMVCQQVLIAKRLERAKNAGKRVVIQSCACPTPSVPADAFLTKYGVWRHLGRHKHRLRSHGGTNFAETNSPGGQNTWQTVRQSPQLHGTWRFQTWDQLFLRSVFGHAVQLAGSSA